MVMTTTEGIQIARENGIHPHKCSRCGQTQNNWGSPTSDGREDGPVLFQCNGCGQYNTLSVETVRRRAKEKAAEEAHERELAETWDD